MAEAVPLWVEYPADDPAAAAVVVERVSAAAVDDDLARGVIRLVRDAYVAQYGDRQVPCSELYRAYDPEDDMAVRDRREQIAERIHEDYADYWVVRDTEQGYLAGLAKIMHGHRRTYIGDIVSAPPWGRGIGTRVLHAPLTQSSFDPTNYVELDAFEGSSVNDWYRRLGFEPQNISGQFRVGDTGRTLLMRRYIAPRTVGVDGIVRALEAKSPALTQRTVHYSRP